MIPDDPADAVDVSVYDGVSGSADGCWTASCGPLVGGSS